MNTRTLFVALMLLPAACALCADQEAEELLKKMREAYKGVKSAKVKAESKVDFSGQEQIVTVDLDFKSPSKVRAKMRVPQAGDQDFTILTTGKKIKVEGPTGSEEQDYSLDAMSSALPFNLETISFWDWARQLSTEEGGNMKGNDLKVTKETWNDKEWIVLEENAASQGVFVRYFIDPKTHLIWRTVYMDGGSRRVLMDASIKSLELDAKLEDSIFEGKVSV